MVEELSAVEEIHNEIKLGWGLEGVVELHDKWTVDLLEDVSLSYIRQSQLRVGREHTYLVS